MTFGGLAAVPFGAGGGLVSEESICLMGPLFFLSSFFLRCFWWRKGRGCGLVVGCGMALEDWLFVCTVVEYNLRCSASSPCVLESAKFDYSTLR